MRLLERYLTEGAPRLQHFAKVTARLALQLIREHALALPDDPDLLDELRNVRLREASPGVFRLDHDRGRSRRSSSRAGARRVPARRARYAEPGANVVELQAQKLESFPCERTAGAR